MKVNDSTTFDYLGMNITIKDKKIQIEMKDQIREAIDMFGEPVTDIVSSPTAKHLF